VPRRVPGERKVLLKRVPAVGEHRWCDPAHCVDRCHPPELALEAQGVEAASGMELDVHERRRTVDHVHGRLNPPGFLAGPLIDVHEVEDDGQFELLAIGRPPPSTGAAGRTSEA